MISKPINLAGTLLLGAPLAAPADPPPERVDDVRPPQIHWSGDWFRDGNENRIDDDLEDLVDQGAELVDFMVTFRREDWNQSRADLVAEVHAITSDYGEGVDRDFTLLPTLVVLQVEVSSPLWNPYEGYLDPLMAELLDNEELGVVMVEALHQFVPSAISDFLSADHVVPQLWDPATIFAGTQGYQGLLAIVDSGVESLGNDIIKVAGGYDAFHEVEGDSSDVTALPGGLWHGTRVSYVASGLAFYPETLGVAPFAGTIDVRIADAGSDTTTSDIVITAFDWLYLNRNNTWNIPGTGPPGIDLVGIDAVNISYADSGPVAHRFVPGGGGAGCATVAPSNGSDDVSRAADSLVVLGGIPVVVAAGNCGLYMNGFGDLAAAAQAITVGAYDMGLDPAGTLDDSIFPWSNHGPDPYGKPKPELTAPGTAFGAQGTSYSAPQVAGSAAILRSQYQTASPAAIKDALCAAAVESHHQQGFDPHWGNGMLEAAAALDSLASNPGAPADPANQGAER